MGKLNQILGLFVLLVFPLLARAADAPAAGDAGIGDYIDDQTILVIRADLSTMDRKGLQAWVDQSVKAANGPDAQKGLVLGGLPAAKGLVKTWVEDFKKAGGTTIYVTLNMSDVRDGPEIIVPIADGMDVEAIKKLLMQTTGSRVARRGGLDFATTEKFLLFGTPKVLKDMQVRQPVDRADIAEAMKAAGDGAIRAAFVPSDDMIQTMEDVMPELPGVLGGVQTADLVGSISSGWMSISLPPEQGLRLTMHYKDAASAATAEAGIKAIHDAMQKILSGDATSRPERIKAIITTFLPALAPVVDGDKVVLNLEGDKSNAVIDPLVELIVRHQTMTNRIRSASNLRQIGQAILLYSNDTHGTYPPDMGTLIKTEDITGEMFLNPMTGHKLPENWAGMSPDDQAKWVNDNSDYVFVGAGLKQGADPSIVVVYEKEGPTTGDGINILFADGHVEFENPEQAKGIFEQSRKLGGGPKEGDGKQDEGKQDDAK